MKTGQIRLFPLSRRNRSSIRYNCWKSRKYRKAFFGRVVARLVEFAAHVGEAVGEFDLSVALLLVHTNFRIDALALQCLAGMLPPATLKNTQCNGHHDHDEHECHLH